MNSITEVLDVIQTQYQKGKLQGIVCCLLTPEGTISTWHIHESQRLAYLTATGMADILKQDIHVEAMIKPEALQYKEES